MTGATHTWRVRKYLADRFGQPCRLLVTGRRNSILVEFADGMKVVTCRYFIRRLSTTNSRSSGTVAR